MKTPRFLLIGVPILIVLLIVSYILTRPHFRHREEQAKADQAVSSGSATPAPDSSTPGGHMRAILDKLDLTDAQKAQIAQIRQNTTDRQQRRAAILAVLTLDQRAKFDQLRAAQGNPAPPAPAP